MKLLCISLGCDKNLVDSEKMLGMLYEDGFSFTDDETEAALSYSVLATDDGPGLVCELTNTGFSVNRLGSYMPFLNDDGRNYRYIAFR